MEAINFIHTVIFDGPELSGKSTLKKAFDARTGGAYMSYENGPLSYMIQAKEKKISHPLPARIFCHDLKHALIVYCRPTPLALIQRLVNVGDDTIQRKEHTKIYDRDGREKIELYDRAVDILKYYVRNVVTVDTSVAFDQSGSLDNLLKYLKTRNYNRIKKFLRASNIRHATVD